MYHTRSLGARRAPTSRLLDNVLHALWPLRPCDPRRCMHDACVHGACVHDACVPSAYVYDACICDACICDACIRDECIRDACICDAYIREACIRHSDCCIYLYYLSLSMMYLFVMHIFMMDVLIMHVSTMHVYMILDPDTCVFDAYIYDPRSLTLTHVCMMNKCMMHISTILVPDPDAAIFVTDGRADQPTVEEAVFLSPIFCISSISEPDIPYIQSLCILFFNLPHSLIPPRFYPLWMSSWSN